MIRRQRPSSEAALLLYGLLRIEEGRNRVLEPACPVPPWLEVEEGDLYNFLWAQNAAALLPVATHQIAKGLRLGDMGCVSLNLSALEVMALSGFWTEEMTQPSFTCGSMRLKEDGGRVGQDWLTMGVAADSIALWLFNDPFPVRLESGGLATDENKTLSFSAATEPVTTVFGTFEDSLKVVRRTVQEGSPYSADLLTVWLARDIGPVRVRREDADGSRREIDLTEYSVSGEGYFPRAPGNYWRFDSRDEFVRKERIIVRRESWRMLADPEEKGTWLVNSVYQDRREG